MDQFKQQKQRKRQISPRAGTSSQPPQKKRKKRSDEYIKREAIRKGKRKDSQRGSDVYKQKRAARKAAKKALIPDKDRRTPSSNFMRQNNDPRRSEAARVERKDPDLRRSGPSLERRQNRDHHRNASDTFILEYETAIRQGPTEVCQCCGGLFFALSIRIHSNSSLRILLDELFNEVICLSALDERIGLCITCSRDIGLKKTPRLCLSNGFAFPELPEQLKDLTPLEAIMVSLRLPFMQIRELKIGRQYGIKGHVVNIPINIEDSINILPRTFDQTQTIQISLKRRLKYKTDYINEFVRPAKVFQAAKFLMSTQLFIEAGIKLSLDWEHTNEGEVKKFVINEEDNEEEKIPDETLPEDEWDETKNDLPLNPNMGETMLKQGIVYAPGEDVVPSSLLNDKAVEELSFPTIYCGQERQLKVRASYADICKSELRRYDRRVVKIIPNLFFKLRRKQNEFIMSAINVHLRKGYSNSSKLSASQALDGGYVNELVRNDEAYKFLQCDRTSPVYWQARQKDLMAMIRQLGIPTFFLTLSAAETHWPELLIILEKILNNRVISEDQAMQLSFQEKSELIRKDPVTCARYFHHRTRELFKYIKAKSGPFQDYEVLDHYIRVEFQSRGSPHLHCLLWLKDAPAYNKDIPQSISESISFIDQFLTCEVGDEGMFELERFQYHKHSGTCKKTRDDSVVCRFEIPVYPMRGTHILEPLKDEDLSEEELEVFDSIKFKIDEELRSVDDLVRANDPELNSYTFEKYLEKIGINERTYLRVIRHNIQRPKVFIKRNPREIRTNAYCPAILRRHRANMDLQFILDPYACVKYILNYINKSDRGMSSLMREVVEECKKGNFTNRQKLYKISKNFINCSEVSIQEAVYILLSLPLSKASRDTIFINTGEKESRNRMLKVNRELEKLDPESTDVLRDGILEYYANRPTELEETCLADFAAKYTFKNEKIDDLMGELSLTENRSTSELKKLRLKNNLGTIVERRVPKIIRYRRYQLEKEEQNYFREKVMLYLPWRNEDEDILAKDVRSIYEANRDTIYKHEKSYVNNLELDLNQIQAEVVENNRLEFCHEIDEIAAEYQVHDLQRSFPDIDEEQIRESNTNKSGTFLSPTVLSDDSYSSIIRTLNENQRNFLLGLAHRIKTNREPFYYFLTGGAGTGKSLLITAVYQTLIRWYNRGGANPDAIKVLLMGPTGKSAFNIKGTTIHSALALQVTQCSIIKNLNADMKNTLRAKLADLKAIIIDEVSMVGYKMLMRIDQRLKEIFGTNKDFGGISILFVGDFNQLRPVQDSFIFKEPINSSYNLLAGPVLWQSTRMYKLSEIMRQRDDRVFAEALNRLAVGKSTEEDKNLFNSRLYPRNSNNIPNGAVRLFRCNERVDSYNDKVLDVSEGQIYVSEAIDFAGQDLKKRVRDQALEIVKHLKTQLTYNLVRILKLKEGIRYMVSTNIDIEDGLVNGTDGFLRQVEFQKNGEVSRIWMEFGDPLIGSKARSKFPPHTINGKPLTPIEKIVRDIKTKAENSFVLVSRKQFPVLISEAMTIHKAQGQTYEQVVVDMSRKLDLASFYTAFSRAKTLNGLYLVGESIIFPQPRPDSHPLTIEMRRLETDAAINFEIPFLNKVKLNGQIAIFFQNLPYLMKHREDLECDANIMACDILAFVETRATNVSIRGYQLMHSLAYNSEQSRPFGISFYISNRLSLETTSRTMVHEWKGAHIEMMMVSSRKFLLIIIYVSPKYPKVLALQKIEETVEPNNNKNVIFFGDFNVERESENGKKLIGVMSSNGLQVFPHNSSPSTDRKTCIDYCFSNMVLNSSFFYESLISDHKPLVTVLDN